MANPDAPVEPRLAVLITFDQFPQAGLGCYGNEWVDTAAFDTLAATGFALDTCVATQVPAEEPDAAATSAAWLSEVLSAGSRVVVIFEPAARRLPEIPPTCLVTDCDPGVEPPGSPAEMPFARLMQAARRWLDEHPSIGQPTVLWLHSAGLTDNALPPAEAWDLYADEFSEEGIDWSALSDEGLVRHPAIRAAYLSLMDQWLEQLTTRLRTRPEPILLQILGFGGGLWLPAAAPAPIPGGLDAPRIQVPWIISEQLPTGATATWEPGRSRAIVQPCDIGPTTLEWLTVSTEANDPAAREQPGGIGRSVWPLIRGETTELRPWALTTGGAGAVSIWTPQDQLIFDGPLPADGECDPSRVQRYWQPEDPWNAFDVASTSGERIAAVVETLRGGPNPPSDQPA